MFAPSTLNSEALLVAGVRAGDQVAMARFIEDYGETIDIAMNLFKGSRDEEEDAYQEVWLRVIAGLPTYNEKFPLRGWMYQVARNRIVDLNRTHFRHSQAQERLIEETLGTSPPPFEEYDLRHCRISEAFLTLTELEQEVLELRYTQDLEYKAIASILGGDSNSVRQAKQRAFEKLRGMVK